jgi:hypothetical protein
MSEKINVWLRNEQLKIQGEREKKWHTVAACEHYSSDPILHDVTKSIWKKSNSGSDYTGYIALDHDIIQTLDFLDSLAIGIEQDIYDEVIIKDNLQEVIYKAVKVFIKGESGNLAGRNWIAGRALCTKEEYPFLSRLYDKWFND